VAQPENKASTKITSTVNKIEFFIAIPLSSDAQSFDCGITTFNPHIVIPFLTNGLFISSCPSFTMLPSFCPFPAHFPNYIQLPPVPGRVRQPETQVDEHAQYKANDYHQHGTHSPTPFIKFGASGLDSKGLK
jgi:hypothetical protein